MQTEIEIQYLRYLDQSRQFHDDPESFAGPPNNAVSRTPSRIQSMVVDTYQDVLGDFSQTSGAKTHLLRTSSAVLHPGNLTCRNDRYSMSDRTLPGAVNVTATWLKAELQLVCTSSLPRPHSIFEIRTGVCGLQILLKHGNFAVVCWRCRGGCLISLFPRHQTPESTPTMFEAKDFGLFLSRRALGDLADIAFYLDVATKAFMGVVAFAHLIRDIRFFRIAAIFTSMLSYFLAQLPAD